MIKFILSLMLFSVCLFARIDINTASIDELATIKGIGQKKATAIVKYRKAHGKFKNYDDLLNVKGIGESIVYNIKNDIKSGAGKKSQKVKKSKSTAKKTTSPKRKQSAKTKSSTKKDSVKTKSKKQKKKSSDRKNKNSKKTQKNKS